MPAEASLTLCSAKPKILWPASCLRFPDCETGNKLAFLNRALSTPVLWQLSYSAAYRFLCAADSLLIAGLQAIAHR
jgi:hypothetical protein